MQNAAREDPPSHKATAGRAARPTSDGLAKLRDGDFNLGVNKEMGQKIDYKRIGFSLLIPALLLLAGCANQWEDYTRGVSPVCRVHGTQMTKTNVPIVYGLFAFNEWGLALKAASTNSFPNAEEAVNPGCIVGKATQATIYVCAECQRARRLWISEHPKPRKYTEKSAVGDWVGLDTGWRADTFTLILNPDGTGVLTEAPYDATNHVRVYRYEIARWRIATNDALECEFRQREQSEPLKLTASFVGQGETSLTAVLHNAEGGWKQNLLLWRAKDLDEKIKVLRQ